VSTRPELGYSVPSADQVKGLVTKAVRVNGTTPVDQTIRTAASAQNWATDAMRLYVDQILFGVHPEGQSFRDAVVSWRTPADQVAVKQRMHDDIAKFFADPNTTFRETATAYAWDGPWMGLYSEIAVRKAGGMERLYVEID
jgi:hypothetical protein